MEDSFQLMIVDEPSSSLKKKISRGASAEKRVKTSIISEKRKLTEHEIDFLLDFIQPQKGIPFEVAMSIVDINRAKFIKSLEKALVNPLIIPKLKQELQSAYQKSLIEPGENVSIIAAQSFGQFQTQSTLNSFHKAGLSEKTVVSGVSRFSEILDATKTPKGSSCIVYFTKGFDTLFNLRKTISSTIVGLTLKQLCQKCEIVFDKQREDWYDTFEMVYNDKFKQFDHCISVILDEKLLFQYSLTLEEIALKIEETYADLVVVFSPLHLRRMDIFVDTTAIQMPEKCLSYVTPENAQEVYMEDVVIPNLEKLLICGVSGITNMFFTSQKDASGNEQWFVETEGSNFSDILAHPLVDKKQTITNNMREIFQVLGIEAARQYMIEEITASMSGINPCHSKLLVDKMTYNGNIVSISRYAMRSEGSGALSKASFEEPFDNLLSAAVYGEKELTDGVSAGIICGKLGRFGTGMCDVRVDVEKLQNMNAILGSVKEEMVI